MWGWCAGGVTGFGATRRRSSGVGQSAVAARWALSWRLISVSRQNVAVFEPNGSQRGSGAAELGSSPITVTRWTTRSPSKSFNTWCCVQRLSHMAMVPGVHRYRTVNRGCCTHRVRCPSSSADSSSLSSTMRRVKCSFTNNERRPVSGTQVRSGVVVGGEPVAQLAQRCRQFLVGLARVGPHRVAPHLGYDLRLQDGELRGMALTRDVAVPFVGDATLSVGGAQFEELGALALQVEVGVCLEFAEEATEGDVLVGVEVLFGEEQHHVLDEQVVDQPGIGRVRPAEGDAVHLGAERARQPANAHFGRFGHRLHGRRAYAATSPTIGSARRCTDAPPEGTVPGDGISVDADRPRKVTLS
jgi:hypothetical protein